MWAGKGIGEGKSPPVGQLSTQGLVHYQLSARPFELRHGKSCCWSYQFPPAIWTLTHPALHLPPLHALTFPPLSPPQNTVGALPSSWSLLLAGSLHVLLSLTHS